MKQNSITKMIRCLLVLTACLFVGAGTIFAQDLTMNVQENAGGGMLYTPFCIYMEEADIALHPNYYHPDLDGSGDTDVYLKLDLDKATELWTDMVKECSVGGSVCLDVLLADKKTVIFSRNVVFNTGHSNPIAFRGTLPGGTYYFHFHRNIENDCVTYTNYRLYVGECIPLSSDDDIISTNNTKENATLIKENESVTGFLNVMGTDPADWYKFTVTGEIGILDVKCASWRGMESVLLKEDGSAVEGGENLTSDNSLELAPGTYYLGYKYIQTDDPSGGRTYTISFSQQSKLTGISLDPEEIEMRTEDFDALHAAVVPENSRGVTVSWSSSDESIVTVVDYPSSYPSKYHNTNIYSHDKTGTAIITVKTTDGSNLSASCKVTVVERPSYTDPPVIDPAGPSGTDTSNWYIRFPNKQISLYTDDVSYVEYSYRGNDSLVWMSSDEKVVSTEGWKIKAHNPGKATVTAYFSAHPSIKAECEITVSEDDSDSWSWEDGGFGHTESSYSSSYSSTSKSTSSAAKSVRKATIKASKSTVKRGKKTTVKILSNAGSKLTIKGKTKNARNKKYVTIKGAKITFKKKAPKGKYKFTATSAAKGSFKKTTKTITIKVK